MRLDKLASTTLAVAGAVTLLIVSIYPPQNAFWPYFAYTVVLPSLWIPAILLQRPVRTRVGEWYHNLGGLRVPVTALMVLIAGVLGGVWMWHLPTPPMRTQARYAVTEIQTPSAAAATPTTKIEPIPDVPNAQPAPSPKPPAPRPTPPVQQAPPLPDPAPQTAPMQEPAPATVVEPSSPVKAPEVTTPLPTTEIRLQGNRCEVLAQLIPLGRSIDNRCRTTDCANEADVKIWTDAALSHIRQNFPLAIVVAFENPPQQFWAVHDFPASGPKLRMLHELNWRWQYLIRVVGSSLCTASSP